MSAEGQLRILQLCRGKSIKQALYRLEVTEQFHRTNVLKQRIRLSGIIIGD